jgi:hypothetical protein
MTELSSTHTEEDRIGDWFAAQLESGAMAPGRPASPHGAVGLDDP